MRAILENSVADPARVSKIFNFLEFNFMEPGDIFNEASAFFMENISLVFESFLSSKHQRLKNAQLGKSRTGIFKADASLRRGFCPGFEKPDFRIGYGPLDRNGNDFSLK